MKLLADGPDIPMELLTAQEKGEVLFICGAGVSKTVGLPLFRGLVIKIYKALGENWELHPAEKAVMEPNGRLYGQYDRVLRFLERRLTAGNSVQANRLRKRLRDAVRAELQPPKEGGTHLSAHTALLELSRDAENNIRLVTTNFDTLFERAWPREGRAPSYAGPAMPQPKTSGCAGVLHLHGRLADETLGLPETDLVLTSAEFGEAYLRSGWASRYVYDLVRAYTVVLVGYQADDPPMRYLLEVLESDRERYSDLKHVYAFTEVVDGDEQLTRALWEGKGVIPILHDVDADGRYDPLYSTILEWRTYAQDPTAWRREQLRKLFSAKLEAPEDTVLRVTEILRHGDASQLLSELNPPARWLPLLRQQRIFDSGIVNPGPWIGKRFDDPDMIRAVAGHPALTKDTVWHIRRALDDKRGELGSVRTRAWEILLSAKKPCDEIDHDISWFSNKRRIQAGETGYNMRRLVAGLLRPMLTVSSPFRLYEEQAESPGGEIASETISSLLWLDFKTSGGVDPDDIVETWPQDEISLVKLLQVLERTLIDALEHAEDVEFISDFDRSDYDVPSVAPHEQNKHRSGFYPIVRVIADLWGHLAKDAPERAREMSRDWKRSPYHLIRRLGIYAATNTVHPAEYLVEAILGLCDHDFWERGIQVEIMRGLVARWEEFSEHERARIEARINAGIPRELFDKEAFNKEQWETARKNAIFRRLTRLQSAGKVLCAESVALLREIKKHHPEWQPSIGERGDFRAWSETLTGLQGDVNILSDVPDTALVNEALRIETERRLDQGELWRLFCSSDPARALRGLLADGEDGNWNTYAWRSLFWVAGEAVDDNIKEAIADAVLAMPDATLRELAGTIADWVRKHRRFLEGSQVDGRNRFWLLWDRLADLVFANEAAPDFQIEDPVTPALNEPGGVLAWALIDHFVAAKPEPGSELGDLEGRFNRIVRANGESGFLGRIHFARALSYLHHIAPSWTAAEMLLRFNLEHPEAIAMWKANADAPIESAALYNMLKSSLLEVIPRPELSHHESGNLAARLFQVLVWHQLGCAEDYKLDPREVRDLLVVSPARIREHFAWQFWHLQSANKPDDETLAAKGARWRGLVGPLFQKVWPLDARLQTESASRNLVSMVLDTDDAFPAAVDAVIDVLKPYELYSMEHTFRLEKTNADLIDRFPRAAVKLANALIDPRLYPVPHDLGKLLDDCQRLDPEIVHEPVFLRLSGFMRLGGA